MNTKDLSQRPATLNLQMTMAQAEKLSLLLMDCNDQGLVILGSNMYLDIANYDSPHYFQYLNGTREGTELIHGQIEYLQPM